MTATSAAPARSRLPLLVALHATLALAYAGLLARDLGARERLVSTDFAAYDTGATLVAEGAGARLYDAGAQAETQARLIAPHHFPGALLAFLNPPHVALALAPLAWLDFVTAFRLWTALQILLVALVARAAAEVARARAPLARWTIYAAVAAFWPVFYAVQIGQLSVLLTLAVLRLHLALERGDDRRAGAWLFVLAAKPQLLPIFPLYLASVGRARALGWAGLIGAGAFALTAAVLGARVWASYVHGLTHLEGFFAQGTPEHMVCLRGLLSELLGASRPTALASLAALAGALVVAGARWRGPPPAAPDARDRRAAAALALALFFCPHLFPQDVALWIAPLVIFARGLTPPRALGFAPFALSWPFVFFAIAAVAGATGHAMMPLALAPLVVATAWLVRADVRARSAA